MTVITIKTVIGIKRQIEISEEQLQMLTFGKLKEMAIAEIDRAGGKAPPDMPFCLIPVVGQIQQDTALVSAYFNSTDDHHKYIFTLMRARPNLSNSESKHNSSSSSSTSNISVTLRKAKAESKISLSDDWLLIDSPASDYSFSTSSLASSTTNRTVKINDDSKSNVNSNSNQSSIDLRSHNSSSFSNNVSQPIVQAKTAPKRRPFDGGPKLVIPDSGVDENTIVGMAHQLWNIDENACIGLVTENGYRWRIPEKYYNLTFKDAEKRTWDDNIGLMKETDRIKVGTFVHHFEPLFKPKADAKLASNLGKGIGLTSASSESSKANDNSQQGQQQNRQFKL